MASPTQKSELQRALKQIQSKKDWDSLIVAAKNAIQEYPKDRSFKKTLHKAQANYVKQKLDSDLVHKLEQSKDYQTLKQVYQKLLSVFPESKELKKLLKHIDQKIQNADSEQHKAALAEAKQHINQLLKEKAYDQAQQAAYELLSYDSNNKLFRSLLAKVNKKRDRVIEKELSTYFKEAIPTLKQAFQKNPDSFIRV